MPGPTIAESAQEREVIFIGKCIAGEFEDEGNLNSPETYKYKTIWTFEVQKIFKGNYKSKTIKIETGMGGGDCGVPFRLGASYLVYGGIFKGNIGTGICSRTKIIGFYPTRINDKAKKEIKVLERIFNQTE